MVGDRVHDIEGARAFGIDAIAVSWGTRPTKSCRPQSPRTSSTRSTSSRGFCSPNPANARRAGRRPAGAPPFQPARPRARSTTPTLEQKRPQTHDPNEAPMNPTTQKKSLTRRTLHYFWLVTRKHAGLFALLMLSTIAFSALLSYGNPYVMSLVVDRVSADPVPAEQVFDVFGPYIFALIAINVAGQAASKLQDYTMYKLEIAATYDLATMSFDALCNQSMSFHSNRFGGTLVSQTSKFMSAYQLMLETITFPFLPVACSIFFTCAILAPRVPVYVVILMALLAVYACVSYYMYKRILHLNEKAASAQNQLSGELSDSVANILAVKTYGREDYERALFDQANREVVARDSSACGLRSPAE